MGSSNEAVLFLSHSASPEVIAEYSRIHGAIGNLARSFFGYHQRNHEVPLSLSPHELYLFSDESLSKLNYQTLGTRFLPGHVGFVLLQFFRDNPHFSYYWRIEHDVRFSGDWRFFFDGLDGKQHDFLTCHIRYHAEEPDWPWWALHHPVKSIPLGERLRSFNPICRLSNASLVWLHQCLSEGWCGHDEVLLPTLLYHHGSTIMDIGGKGTFTPQHMQEKFYTESRSNSAGALETGTMRFRPSFWRVGHDKNKLYHPIKPILFVIRERMRNLERQWGFPFRLARQIRDALLSRS